jgi:hypothetical protein
MGKLMKKRIDKGNPIHGLEKIPDSELLKISQQEVGQWKSYAQELEDKVTELERKLAEKEESYKLTEEDKRAVTMKLREDEIWNNTKAQVKSLQERIKKVEKTNKEYIARICQLSQEKKIDRSKEYLLCAAIRRKEERDCPKVYWEQYRDIYKIELGWRHPDILHRFIGEVSKNPDDQGFYTSKGRFVTREEGLIIARAAGQVGDIIGGVLTSEDLY